MTSKIQLCLSRCHSFWACLLLMYLCWVIPAFADIASITAGRDSETLTLDQSVRFALENNPQLRALRAQHGIAAASVIIAKTYPFNPVYQGTILHIKGGEPSITNNFPSTHQLTLEVQLFNQQKFRQEVAFAALTRTDWEISSQELLFSINAIKAFDGYLYRQGKLSVTEDFLRLNQKSVEQIAQLVERGTLKPGDLIIARAEVNDIAAQVSLNRTALVTAKRDFYRALGLIEGDIKPAGTMERVAPQGLVEDWRAAALELRPDIHARLAAVEETEADVKFQRADRYANVQVGPVYETNESGSNFIGAKIQVPFPIINNHPGEIQQAEARKRQAAFFVRQLEVEIKQDVMLSSARVTEASKWVQNYRTEIVPALKRSLRDIDQLLQQGQVGVDVLRVLDVRRKLLRAQDGFLDALLAYTQALADLALAIGDPALALGVYKTVGASTRLEKTK